MVQYYEKKSGDEKVLESPKELQRKLESRIQKCSKVFIVGHNNPDFDSIGSAIGLSVLAEKYGKEVHIVVDDDELKIEPGVKKIMENEKEKYSFITKSKFLELKDKYSILIVTDTNKKSMISLGDSLESVETVFVLDHHSEGEDTIPTKNAYISGQLSSASELVARILYLSKTPYPKEVANYLLAGISLDTNRFRQNTTDKTHDIAEKLIKRGADIDFVNNLFLEEFESYCRISDLIVHGTVIKKYSRSLLNAIQVSFSLNREKPTQIYLKEDYAKAADRMMKFTGIDAAFTLGYVDKGIVHISARSGKRVDVGTIMKEMGGGGTAQSAGGRIETDDLFRIEKRLMCKVRKGISSEEELTEEPPTIKVKQLKK